MPSSEPKVRRAGQHSSPRGSRPSTINASPIGRQPRSSTSRNHRDSRAGARRVASPRLQLSAWLNNQETAQQSNRNRQGNMNVQDKLNETEAALKGALEELYRREQDAIQAAKEREDLRSLIKGLRRKEQALQEQIEGMSNTMEQYRGVFDDKAKESMSLKRKIRELEDRTKSIKQGSSWSITNFMSTRPKSDGTVLSSEAEKQYQTLIQALETKNNQLVSDAAGLKKQFKEMQAELLRELSELSSQNYFNPVEVSDTGIQQSWKNVGFLICQFAETYFKKYFEAHELQLLKPGPISNLQKICATPELAVQSAFTCPALLQAFLWNFISWNIFDSQATHWAGEIGEDFFVASDSILEYVLDHNDLDKESSLTEFHEWRARSMSMLVRLGVHKSPDHTKLAHQMVELFAPFFSTPLEASDGAKAVKDFHAIIAAATKLDIQLRQSKAHYRCFHHTTTPPKKPDYFGYSFDPNTMEQGNFGPRMDQSRPDSLPVVDLVLSPGLIKSGNADGKNYLSERVSVKMEVLCNLDYIFKLQFGEDDEDEVDETYQTPDSSLSKEDDQTSVGARQSTVRVKEESSDDGDMESDVDMFAVAAQLSDLYESGKVKMESM